MHNIDSKINKYINRYNLKIIVVKKIDLRDTYAQFHQEYEDIDLRMNNSPHHELASLYYKNGAKWVRKNFHKTRYCILKSRISNKNELFSKKKVFLYDSIKKGYLNNNHKNNYIVVLNKPLIVTRFCFNDVSLRSPEVFVGHHRIGALLALDINKANVMVVEDAKPGSFQCYGKLNDKYKMIAG